MGNECKVCRKRNPEEEIILNAPIQKNNQSETLENSQSYTKYLTFKEIINSNPEHYKKLHKIKKALLSYQKRQIYKNMLKKFHESQKTFLYEEYIETLSNTKALSSLEKIRCNIYRPMAWWISSWNRHNDLVRWCNI